MSCCAGSRPCSCNACKGVKLNQFPTSSVLSSANQFVMAGNKLIAYSTLLNSMQAALVAPSFTPTIREADITDGINVGVGTDIVICRGTGDVNMPSVALATKPVTIISANGTATIIPDGADGTDQVTLTTGNAFAATPYQFESKWVDG